MRPRMDKSREQKREERYSSMKEEELRANVKRFSEELKVPLGLEETELKLNSLKYAMAELFRRGLPVAPVIIPVQGKEVIV